MNLRCLGWGNLYTPARFPAALRPPRWIALVAIVIAPAVSASATGSAPVPVSPGDSEGLAATGFACPTFTWTQAPGARGYELLVVETSGADDREPVLRADLPAGASAWTPAQADCLETDRAYAWLVRELGEAGPGPWSEPRLFRVEERPALDREAVVALLGDAIADDRIRAELRALLEREDLEHEESRGAGAGEARRAAPGPSAPADEPGAAQIAPKAAANPRLHVTGDVVVEDGDYTFDTNRVFYRKVPAVAFIVQLFTEEDDTWEMRLDGYGEITAGSDPMSVDLMAPVHLPDGAEVLGLVCFVHDSTANDDLSLFMGLRRRPRSSGGSGLMASVNETTSGTNSGIQTFSTLSVTDRVIDNFSYNYYLRGTFSAEAIGGLLRFYGCEIQARTDRLSAE